MQHKQTCYKALHFISHSIYYVCHLKNILIVRTSDVFKDPKPINPRGTTRNFKTTTRTRPRKAEPKTTPTLDFNYKTPKSKGDVPEMLIPEPDPDFCSPNTSLGKTKCHELRKNGEIFFSKLIILLLIYLVDESKSSYLASLIIRKHICLAC